MEAEKQLFPMDSPQENSPAPEMNPPEPPIPPTLKKIQEEEALHFPKVGMMDKQPAPLLSRRPKGQSAPSPIPRPPKASIKEPPKGPIPPAATAPGNTVKLFTNEKRKTAPPSSAEELVARYQEPRTKKWWFFYSIAWIFTLCFIAGVGYTSYLMFRETRLEGSVTAPDIRIVQVAIIRDFSPDIAALKKELILAHGPLQNDLKDLEEDMTRVKADIAGREERIRLLQQESSGVDHEADFILKEANAAARGVWAGSGTDLDNEYQQKLKEFQDRIEQRAKEFNLNYQPSTDVQSPEVWVNAFQLSLYNAPPAINPAGQRLWAEQQLTDWNNYVKTRDQRMTEIRAKVADLQNSPKPKIDQINLRRGELQAQINDTNTEIEPLQQELKQKQADYAKVKTEEDSLGELYYPRVEEAADSKKLTTLPVNMKNNSFSWRHIDHFPEFPAGDYLLWIKASKNGDEYWAVVPFSLYNYVTTQLIIEPGAFYPVAGILAGSDF